MSNAYQIYSDYLFAKAGERGITSPPISACSQEEIGGFCMPSVQPQLQNVLYPQAGERLRRTSART